MAPAHQKPFKEELDKMLTAGIIRPASTAWSFHVVIPTKKYGKPQFCVDYWALNSRMKADCWPITMIEELYNDLGGAEYIYELELFTGYWPPLICD